MAKSQTKTKLLARVNITTRKQYSNDQLIQQGAFLVVKTSIIATRRKTGREKYEFSQRVYYLVVNIPKLVVSGLKILAKEKARQFLVKFWGAKQKRRRLYARVGRF